MNWHGMLLEFAFHAAMPLVSLWALLALAHGHAHGGRRARAVATSLARRPATSWAVLWGGLFVALYFGLGFGGSGDHALWMQQHVEPIRAGLMPGRDVECFYSPLFPYLQYAGAAMLGFTVPGSLLPFLAGGFIAVMAGHAVGRRLLGTECAAVFCVWLLVDPSLWYGTLLVGQDEVLFAALLLVALWCVAAIVGAASGRRQSMRLFVVFGTVVLIIYGAFGLAGHGLLPTDAMASRARDSLGHSISLSRFVGSAPATVRALYVATACVGLAAVFAARWRARGQTAPMRALICIVAGHAALALLMPYELPSYLAQAMPLVVLLGLADPSPRRRAGVLTCAAMLSFLASIWRGGTPAEWYLPLLATLSMAFHGLLLRSLLRRAPGTAPEPAAVAPAGSGR